MIKSAAKCAANAICRIAVLPVVLLYLFQGLFFRPARVFPGWSQAFSLVPGCLGVYLRRAFYRSVLPECGSDLWVSFGTVFSHPSLEIGSRVSIGCYCSIGDAKLGDKVQIASHVSIINGGRQHDVTFSELPRSDQAGEFPKVTIERNAWIGERAVVMTDVGEAAIVGAGAVVTKPAPAHAVVVGVPARVLRWNRDPEVATRASELTVTD